MKIDVRSIVRDHISTLYNAETMKVSALDLSLFFAFPVAVGIVAFIYGFEIKVEAYNVSITFFGIFIALLLNIQVAIFSIFQRKWETPSDSRLAEIQEKVLAERRTLLTELNANLSYLILACCIALFAALVFYVKEWKTEVAPSIMLSLYAHFLLTLIMVVKRAHALFHKEYRDA